jgi:hypothetical protein
VVNGFQVWWVVVAYTIAMLAVGFHLRHGTWSALTTLGLNTSATARRRLNVLAYAVAGVITVVSCFLHMRSSSGWWADMTNDKHKWQDAFRRVRKTQRDGQLSRRRRLLRRGETSPTRRRRMCRSRERWDERGSPPSWSIRPTAQAERDHRGHRAGRASAAATLGEAATGHQLLLPGQPAARTLHCRAGRHQRGQELPQRRRLDLPLFYDTVKGGDFRPRESNVYRLARSA